MRAWHLGAVLTIIGFLMMIYAMSYPLMQQFPIGSWFSFLFLGVMVFFLGIAILGIKFRQWIERH